MLVDKAIAYQMEACLKQTHIEVTKTYPQGKLFDINGGTACFSGFDSFLSQVVGWGFNTKEKNFKFEIEAIERFYHELGYLRVDIELCPFVNEDLAIFLTQRDYKIDEWNNVSVLDVNNYNTALLSQELFTISKVDVSKYANWAKTVAFGFGYPEAEEQFNHYIMALGVDAFAAYYENKMVAGATIAIHGEVGDLGVTSTLPNLRNKGLQKALLNWRLDYAKQKGIKLVTVTTKPGSISDLNVQKAGFRCAYTRIKMSRDIQKCG